MTLAALCAAVAMLAAAGAAWDLGRARPAGSALARSLPIEPGRALAGTALGLGLAERLARAGLAERVSLASALACKAAGAVAGALGAASLASTAPGRAELLVWICMPAAGFLAPDALLERATRRRHARIFAALPDALDLLGVSTAAGRSAAAGLGEVAASGEDPLAAELSATAAEIGCGVSQQDALRRLRERISGSEVAALVAALERSRRYGSPLADQLRRQAQALRTDQRRAVEERAARAAPKIQLVVALILVPSVLLMIVAALVANADLLFAGL